MIKRVPLLLGLMAGCSVVAGDQTASAQTARRAPGIGPNDVNAAIQCYAQRQQAELANARFVREHAEWSVRVPRTETHFEANAVREVDEETFILACSFPTLTLQDEPATQPAEKPADQKPSSAHGGASLEEINNKLNNPGASLASLNFKFTWNHYKGDLPEASSQNSLTMNFQPVFPFKLDDHGSNLMVRPSIPVVWQPSYNAGRRGFDENFGIGDSQLVMFYANTNKETGFFWGAGPTMQFPTHTDDVLGNDAFMIGPAAYAGIMGKWGVAGVFPQHWWNVGGGDGYTSLTATQLFYWFSVGQGYQVGGAPTITYNWAADDSDQAWTVPVNLGVTKTVMLGGTPVKLKFEGIYYIVQPDAFGPHCGLQLTITPVIPNPFDALFAKK